MSYIMRDCGNLFASGLSKNLEKNFSDKSSSKCTHEAYFLNLTIKYEYKIVIHVRRNRGSRVALGLSLVLNELESKYLNAILKALLMKY